MSIESFVKLYQELLTITEPDPVSMARAKAILVNLLDLCLSGNKMEFPRMIAWGIQNFDAIYDHRDEFIGKPGDYKVNEEKRQRLRRAISAHC
jgi:chromosome condensin MukBEF complex kleisin-like MukF subunit